MGAGYALHSAARGLSVASGMYFYRMQAADFVKVNKMLLMK